MPEVLVIANILHKKEGPFADVLRSAGFSIRFPKDGYRQLTEAELAAELGDAVATIAGSEPYTPAIFAANPQLRAIARTGVGYDAIDLAAAAKAKVAVCLTLGANHDAVAEQTFALLLAVGRHVIANHLMVVGGGFTRTIPVPMRGMTLGLIGLGRIGRAVAIRAIVFGMKVVAFDPTPGPSIPGVACLSFNEVLECADYLSLHAPMIPATRRMINADAIEKMKAGVRIVNTARGGLIDEDALAAALHCGKVAAAGLDVFAEEPPVGSPLLTAPNVTMAPHVAGLDTESVAAMGLMAAQNIVDLYQGRFPAERVVNADDLPDWRWA
jgi:D-3-phosphoglycerate dehydrogenase / 2-oxoglutarate reductase